MLAHYMREKDNGGCCLGRERLLFNFRVLAFRFGFHINFLYILV